MKIEYTAVNVQGVPRVSFSKEEIIFMINSSDDPYGADYHLIEFLEELKSKLEIGDKL